MDVTQFWQLIERTRIENDHNGEQQAALLIEELVQLSLQDIIIYDNIFDDFCARADKTNLQDAAHFIVSFGDSGWHDFRGWLVGQGKQTYERVLANPDELAEIIPLETRFDIGAELLLYAGQHAYEIKKGDRNAVVPLLPNENDAPIERGESLFKTFTTWEDYFHRFAEKYPRVWEKFHDEMDESN